MVSATDARTLVGSTAYAQDGDKLGKVGQVYLDDVTGEPTWVTVSTGFFGTSESFVPLEGARLDGEDLRLAYTKDRVKDAPTTDADGHLDRGQEDRLYEYYGLATSRASGPDARGDASGTERSYGDTGEDSAVSPVTSGPSAGRGVRDGHETAMTVSEERLAVDTEQVETGRVRLRKYVTSETETVEVPVKKEKLVVDRVPVDGTSAPAGAIGDGDEVEEITLSEERAVVDVETVAVEEVRIGKEVVTDTEEVQAELRKEHVDIDGDHETR